MWAQVKKILEAKGYSPAVLVTKRYEDVHIWSKVAPMSPKIITITSRAGNIVEAFVEPKTPDVVAFLETL